MKIFIRMISGATVILEVELSDTIADIKRKIEDKEGHAPEAQILIFAGKSLEDDRSLRDCGVFNELCLVIRRSRMEVSQIFAKIAEPDRTVGTVDANKIIEKIEAKIQVKEGCPAQTSVRYRRGGDDQLPSGQIDATGPDSSSFSGQGKSPPQQKKNERLLNLGDPCHFYVTLGRDLDRHTGRFKILSLLGQGTYGKVLQCWDRKYKKIFAVKVARSDYGQVAKEEISRLDLVTEGDPSDIMGIVKLTRWFEMPGKEPGNVNHVCAVFPLHGESLHNTISPQSCGPFSAGFSYSDPRCADLMKTKMRLLAEIIFEVGCAVHYLHHLGWMHTDLKPANIIWDQPLASNPSRLPEPGNAKVRIIDLGNCVKHGNGGDCMYVTTVQYRAPEVILGLGFDRKVDSWALGVIISELATGTPLFPFGNSNLVHLHEIQDRLGLMLPKSWGQRCWDHSKKEFCKSGKLRTKKKSTTTLRHMRTKMAHLPLELINLVDGLLKLEAGDRLSMLDMIESDFCSKFYPEGKAKSEAYQWVLGTSGRPGARGILQSMMDEGRIPRPTTKGRRLEKEETAETKPPPAPMFGLKSLTFPPAPIQKVTLVPRPVSAGTEETKEHESHDERDESTSDADDDDSSQELSDDSSEEKCDWTSEDVSLLRREAADAKLAYQRKRARYQKARRQFKKSEQERTRNYGS